MIGTILGYVWSNVTRIIQLLLCKSVNTLLHVWYTLTAYSLLNESLYNRTNEDQLKIKDYYPRPRWLNGQ